MFTPVVCRTDRYPKYMNDKYISTISHTHKFKFVNITTQSIFLSICVCVSIYLSVYLCMYPFICLSIVCVLCACLSICVGMHLSVYLSVCMFPSVHWLFAWNPWETDRPRSRIIINIRSMLYNDSDRALIYNDWLDPNNWLMRLVHKKSVTMMCALSGKSSNLNVIVYGLCYIHC